MKLVYHAASASLPHYAVGVLDTPMHPARYYAGFIKLEGGEYSPVDNSTSLYHRTLDLAKDAAVLFALRVEKARSQG